MSTSTLPHGASVWRPAIWKWMKSIGLALAVMALAGCESTTTIPAAKISRTPVIPQDDYRIGAGDSLKIFVWRNEDLTTQVAVRPDGKISMPLVSDMVAAGKTPSQLAEDLTNVLSEY